MSLALKFDYFVYWCCSLHNVELNQPKSIDFGFIESIHIWSIGYHISFNLTELRFFENSQKNNQLKLYFDNFNQLLNKIKRLKR